MSLRLLEILILAALPPCGALALWLSFRRKKQNFAAIIALLAFVFFLAHVLQALIFGGGFGVFEVREFLASPVFLIINILGDIIGILLTFRYFGHYIFPTQEGLDLSNPANLRRAVVKILDSESFLTALRSTLPTGKHDHLFGFDHIPYILNSIDERRRRATKSARLFLLSTIFASVLFSGVVIYFGIILVNEASAGTPKAVSDVKSKAESISDSLKVLLRDYFRNPKFQSDVVPYLEKVAQIEAGQGNTDIQKEFRNALNRAKDDGDFSALQGALSAALNKISRKDSQEQAFAKAADNAVNKMTEFRNAQSLAIPNVVAATSDLRALMAKTEESLGKPENRTPELIKRLGLGIVISTFFLALLRYLGNLYRIRYLQVVQAETDDFMVRKFYVTLRNATVSEKKDILTTFLAARDGSAKPNESADDSSKQEFEIIKELVKAASKKL